MKLSPFDITGQTIKPVIEERTTAEHEQWWNTLLTEAMARKAEKASQSALSSTDIEALAQKVFDDIRTQALDNGIRLPEEYLLRLIGELAGLGILLELIARNDIEDIAVNLGHIYIYTTTEGWIHVGPAPASTGDALRVMIDRGGQHTPTPDYPIVDAMLQVMVPTVDGVRRKGIRINYIMPPASPYGDTITIRVSNYGDENDLKQSGLAYLCQNRLPPIKRTQFSPQQYPRTNSGVFSPEAANYILGVMVTGGTLIISGATGSGKTFVAQKILQDMLNFMPPGTIRLFIIEDSNEIHLNGWTGDNEYDTGNIVYAVTRPKLPGGPPAIEMYELIRAALRSRPHGIVIGEARGAEAWELIRAAATGHGHSAFTIHATSAGHVWDRFLQVVKSSQSEAKSMTDFQIAQSFAEAVTTIVHIERNSTHGQIATEIVEVSPIVERAAARPAFSPLFRIDTEKGALLPTGNRPMRPGFRASDLNLPDAFFIRSQY